MTSLKQELYELLKIWCDGLINYQITEINDRNLKGGILCPACSIIHGRCGNAIPAMLFLAEKEREEKYIRCAEGLIDWSEQLLCPDGGFVNDTESEWKGITTFAFISLCDAYFGYGHILSEAYREKLYHQMTATLDYLIHTFDYHSGNINYLVAQACALDKAGIYFDNPSYREKAREIYEEFSHYFTENNLIYGEGAHNWEEVSETGCRPVDIGYSVEEILNHLVLYGVTSGNERVLEQAQRSAESYLHFFLPDGGWDNSFGTRMDTWTYWGSRTSDGAQSGLCILAKYDPVFAEAAQRNFELYEKCSLDGYLYGGRMYIEAGEEPCTHHSFCHAKALAAMIDTGFEYTQKVTLPRELEYGVKAFPSVHVHLISKGDWRATISDDDAMQPGNRKTSSGGSVTLLWNQKTGPVFAATVPKYERSEPLNMQWSRHDDDMDCATLRISDHGYESVNDFAAVVDVKETEQGIEVVSKGHLKDTDFQPNGKFELAYLFQENRFTVTAKAENECVLKLPVICSNKDNVEVTDNKIEIERNGAVITLSSEKPLELEHSIAKRRFHVIGGFETIGVILKLSAGEAAGVTVEIQ